MSSWQIAEVDVFSPEIRYSDDDGKKFSLPAQVNVKLRSTDGALGDDGQDFMYITVEWNDDEAKLLQSIANEVNRKRQAKARTGAMQQALEGKMIRIPGDGIR